MRKKIDVRQLRQGMFVDGWCGAWMDHPFWRAHFLLDDAATLAEVHASGVAQCWIDTAKGLDVQAPALRVEAAPAPAPAALPHPDEPVVPAPRVALHEELGRTAALLAASRGAVMAMFGQARMGRAIDTEFCLPLVEAIAASVARNGGALISLARLKTHDDYTYMHSVAVCALMVALARQLGHGEAATRDAGMAGTADPVWVGVWDGNGGGVTAAGAARGAGPAACNGGGDMGALTGGGPLVAIGSFSGATAGS